jgi:hypothetical protein
MQHRDHREQTKPELKYGRRKTSLKPKATLELETTFQFRRTRMMPDTYSVNGLV